MSLKFNGTTLEKIVFNGTTLDKVIFNSTEVYKRVTPYYLVKNGQPVSDYFAIPETMETYNGVDITFASSYIEFSYYQKNDYARVTLMDSSHDNGFDNSPYTKMCFTASFSFRNLTNSENYSVEVGCGVSDKVFTKTANKATYELNATGRLDYGTIYLLFENDYISSGCEINVKIYDLWLE